MSKGRLQNALAAACVTVSGAMAWAQGGAPVRVPLDNPGVEHLDIVVELRIG